MLNILHCERRKMEGRLSELSLSYACQVYFYYLLNSIFISDVSFGPLTFQTANNTLSYAELRYKTSVKTSNLTIYIDQLNP